MTAIEQQINCLQPNQVLKITPNGFSMYPFFVGGRDDVYVAPPHFPLKRGEIALYLRDNGTYVIHRVYKVERIGKDYQYYMLGDQQTWIEGPLKQSQIHAVAVQIIRKGTPIDCGKNRTYRLLSKLWMLVRPLRPYIFKLKRILYHK